MLDMNPIEKDDIIVFAILGMCFIAMLLMHISDDNKNKKFYADCESNNGVVIINGHFDYMCIKKTAVIDI